MDKLSSEESFAQMFNAGMLRQRTMIIAQVVSFDSEQNSVSVQPCLQRQFVDDESPTNLPIINDVPVSFFGGGGFWITIEPKAGDYCTLHISDRCLDLWKINGGIVSPEKKRHHDFNDAVAYFGINPFNSTIPEVEPSCLHMRSKDGNDGIKLKNGSVTIEHEGSPIAYVSPSHVYFTVPVFAPEFTTESGVVLGTHPHPGVGSPIPTGTPPSPPS